MAVGDGDGARPGACELCGEMTERATTYRCGSCSKLQEEMRVARLEAEAAMRRRFQHLARADTVRGWARHEQVALADSERATADAHEYRLRQARDTLTLRELTWTIQCEMSAEVP